MAPSSNGIPAMNIAFVSDYSYPYTKGGVETRYYALARYLLSRGHRVTWFTSKQWEGAAEHKVEGMRLVSICPAYRTFTSKGKRAKSQALLFGLATFRLLAMPDRFDVIDVSQYPFFHCFPAKLYSILRRVPIVVSWYEFWGDHWFEYFGRGLMAHVGRWIEKTVAQMVGNIVPDSEQARDRLIAAGGDPSHIHYVPLAVDVERISNVKPADDRCDIVYFGRLKEHKNIDKLIRSVAVCRSNGVILQTKICGDGPERQRLEALTKELLLTEQVRFLGRVDSYDDLIAHVKTGRLFVHPSTKEGGGSTTLFEANACGLPVVPVSHPLGFDPCLVREGYNGFWSSNESPEELARVIQKFFSLPEYEQARMSKHAWESAQPYDFRVVYRRIEDIYYKLGALNQARPSEVGRL